MIGASHTIIFVVVGCSDDSRDKVYILGLRQIDIEFILYCGTGTPILHTIFLGHILMWNVVGCRRSIL